DQGGWMREDGFEITADERSRLEEDLQDALRALTRAGVILWRRGEQVYRIYRADPDTSLASEVKTGTTTTFVASRQPEGETQEELQLASADQDGEVQGEEMIIALQPDLLAIIERSVGEYEDFLKEISRGGVQ